MSFLGNDRLTQVSFGLHENRGVFALLLGSGLSSSAGIPTGWQITLDLIRRVAHAQGVQTEPSDGWAAWYYEQTGEQPDYSRVVEQLGRTRDERRATLETYIEPTASEREDGRKVPTRAHQSIADLIALGCIRVVVTTNFDRLLENALRERGVEPTVIASADALDGATPLTHTECYILKIHGDYKDSRILNTDAELTDYTDALNTQLDRVFDEFGLIVCGWSGEWDEALRRAILRAPSRRYPLYWTSIGELGSHARDLIDHRDGHVIPIEGADRFFTDIQSRVHALDRTRRPNPLTTELLVAAAKRYLARPEYRIDLDDLVSQESKRLLAELDHSDFNVNKDDVRLHFEDRVRRFEALSERMFVTAGLLGRWSDGTEQQIILDLIRAITRRRVQMGSGTVIWLDLLTYPALLIVMFYAVGLVSANRWRALHAFLNAPMQNFHSPEQTSVIKEFDQWRWGPNNDVWKLMVGYERQKEPLGRRLFELLCEHAGRFLNQASDADFLMGRYDQLAFITQLESTQTAEIEALTRWQPFQPMPISPGFAACFRGGGTVLSAEIDSPDYRQTLLAAGFSEGDDEHFRACVAYHRKAADYVVRSMT